MPASESHGALLDKIPLAVITAREPVAGNAWITERWRVVGVVGGKPGDGNIVRTVMRQGPEGDQYLWTGFLLRLRAPEADSYYYNLLGQNPSLYIYCDQEDSGEICPRSVTAEYIDAMAHSETGNSTHSVPVPPEIYRLIEQFVVEHHVPEEPKMKRKHELKAKRTGGRDDE